MSNEYSLPGQCNIFVCAILAKLTFFVKRWNGRLFYTFSWEVYTQKINNFCAVKETKCCMCAWIFLVCQESHSYNFGSYFRCHFWWKIIFLTNLKRQTFLHFFLKNYTKRMNNFWKLKKQNFVYARFFPGLPRKLYVSHNVLRFLALLQNEKNIQLSEL